MTAVVQPPERIDGHATSRDGGRPQALVITHYRTSQDIRLHDGGNHAVKDGSYWLGHDLDGQQSQLRTYQLAV